MSTGMPLLSSTTSTFENVPTEMSAAPGKRQFAAATTATQSSPMKYTASGDVGTT